MGPGVRGGPFAPPPLGPLRAGGRARGALGLGAVMLGPGGVPPHRQPPQASALDRFAMVGLASADHPRFVASDVELRRQGPNYTEIGRAHV